MTWKICLASIASAILVACGGTSDTGTPGGGTLVLTATPSTGVIANGTNAVLIHVEGSKAGPVAVRTDRGTFLESGGLTASGPNSTAPFDVTLVTCNSQTTAGCAGNAVVSASDQAGASNRIQVRFVQVEICTNGIDDNGNGLTDCADAPTCPAGITCDAGGKTCGGGACSVCTGKGGAPQVAEVSCGDGFDNDCDGLSDCADPECAGDVCNSAPSTAGGLTTGVCVATTRACTCTATPETGAKCGDGLDNDCDGTIDCEDTDCQDRGAGGQACDGLGHSCSAAVASASSCSVCTGNGGAAQVSETDCADGKDNDCDGLGDCADLDCASAFAVCTATGKTCNPLSASCVCQGPEAARELTCRDGQDNDCDGRIDCADADCASVACTAFGSVCSPTQVGTCSCNGNGGTPQQGKELSCNDGRDNDCDGLSDCADPDCGPTPGNTYGLQCAGTATNLLRCDGLGQCSCTGNGGTPEPVEQSCGDGRDNDCDGLPDCGDADCAARACNGSGRSCTNLAGATNTCSVCAPPGLPALPAEVAEASCGDGRDNDCDGLGDCADGDCLNKICFGAPSTGGGTTTGKCNASRVCACTAVAETAALCGNGIDDDCDGLIDCLDPNCQNTTGTGGDCDLPSGLDRHLTCGPPANPGCNTCTPGVGAVVQFPGPETNCADGFDNDCDGAQDCADPDCAASTFACRNAGFPAATGWVCSTTQYDCSVCSGNGGATEATETSCADGHDNDCDGKTDCEDTNCRSQECNAFGMACTATSTVLADCSVCGGVPNKLETSCTNGADDDCDGFVDCADAANCVAGASCGPAGMACGSAAQAGLCICSGGAAGSESVCTDLKDNDCDGLTDCGDADCNGLSCRLATNGGTSGTSCTAGACVCTGNGGTPQVAETSCSDGFDNDCDGLADCADADCGAKACIFPVGGGLTTAGVCNGTTRACTCTSTAETGALCADGRDNDCDGLADCADPTCHPVGNALGQTCDANGTRCSPALAGGSTCTVCAPGGDPLNAQPRGAETKCADNLDNDCDGRVDCQDATCASSTLTCDATGKQCTAALVCRCPDSSGFETVCSDGQDNDCDGKVDCSDNNCQPSGTTPGKACGTAGLGLACNAAGACACTGNGGAPQARETSCNDGFDNDCDGLADCADPDCQPTTVGTLANACRSTPVPFGGKCDAFGQCVCPGGQATETNCNDGLDNDCDGLIDCADPDCASKACVPSPRPQPGATNSAGTVCLTVSITGCGCTGGQANETSCNDGTDNDCDGKVDCNDPDCQPSASNPDGSLCDLGGNSAYRCRLSGTSYFCKDTSNYILTLSASSTRIPANGSATSTVTAFLQNATSNPPTSIANGSIAFSAVGGGVAPASSSTGIDGRTSTVFTASSLGQVARVTASYTVGPVTVTQSLDISTPALSAISLASQDYAVMGARDSGYQELNELTFLLTDSDGLPYPPGLQVAFEHVPSGGSFIEVGGVGGCVANLCTATAVTDAFGKVRVMLHSGSVAGTVAVSAKASAGGTGLKTMTAGNIAIVGAKASGNEITINCSPQNIPALISHDCTNSNYFGADATVACRVVIGDRYKNSLGVPALVQFFSEAGSMGASATTPPYNPSGTGNDGLGVATGSFRASGAKLPEDVRQQAGEYVHPHNWDGCALVGSTRDHNPRDGLVTIIAVAQGEEGFFDGSNGCPANGLYDPPGSAGCVTGERFVDLGEPFVDINDNGVRDSIVGGGEFDEPYFDANNNGQWDGPNRVRDASTTIWAETRILYTGHVEARLEGSAEAASRFYVLFPSPFLPTPTEWTAPIFDITHSTTTPPPPKPAGFANRGVYMTDLNFNLPNYKTTFGLSKTPGSSFTAAFNSAPTTADGLGMLFRQLYCDGRPAGNPLDCATTCNWTPCVRRADVGAFQYGSFGSITVTGGTLPESVCARVTASLTTTNVISSISTARTIDIPVCGGVTAPPP